MSARSWQALLSMLSNPNTEPEEFQAKLAEQLISLANAGRR
jgi:hypothetical protein